MIDYGLFMVILAVVMNYVLGVVVAISEGQREAPLKILRATVQTLLFSTLIVEVFYLQQ